MRLTFFLLMPVDSVVGREGWPVCGRLGRPPPLVEKRSRGVVFDVCSESQSGLMWGD